MFVSYLLGIFSIHHNLTKIIACAENDSLHIMLSNILIGS